MILYMLVAPVWVMLTQGGLREPPKILAAGGVGLLLYFPTMILQARIRGWKFLSASPAIQFLVILLRDHIVSLGVLTLLLVVLLVMFRSSLEGQNVGALLPALLCGYYVGSVLNKLFVVSLPLNIYEGFILPTLRIAQYWSLTLLLNGMRERRMLQALLIMGTLLLATLIGTLIWYGFLIFGTIATLLWLIGIIFYQRQATQ